MLQMAMGIIPLFVGSIFEQRGHLMNSCVIVGILILFFVAGVIVVGAGVEVSSEAFDFVQYVW